MILVSGASGFVGGHLVPRLLARTQPVIVLTRDESKARRRLGPQVRIVTDPGAIDSATDIDAIINLSGAPILGLPWTRGRRAQLVDSRVGTTRALVALAGRLVSRPRVLVSASAIGYYGVRGDEPIGEDASPTTDFQSRLCQQLEATADTGAKVGMRVVKLRLGLVLGRDGGALPQLARPHRFGMCAVLGSGSQWMSWIHIEDAVRLFELALDRPEVQGAMNAVSPEPLKHLEMQRAIAHTLHRPLWLRVPAFALRAGLGEMAQLLVDGQRVMPNRALSLGFEFRYPRATEALGDLLGGQPGG
jgi:uncharacterized protein